MSIGLHNAAPMQILAARYARMTRRSEMHCSFRSVVSAHVHVVQPEPRELSDGEPAPPQPDIAAAIPTVPQNDSFAARVRRTIFGKPRDIHDSRVFHTSR